MSAVFLSTVQAKRARSSVARQDEPNVAEANPSRKKRSAQKTSAKEKPKEPRPSKGSGAAKDVELRAATKGAQNEQKEVG